MEFIFDNLQWIGIVVFAFIAWLNKRSEMKAEKEDAERARREMIEGMEEMARHRKPVQQPAAPARRATPPPVKKATPPPLKTSRQPEPAASAPDPYMLEASPLDRLDKMQQRLAEVRKQKEKAQEMARKAREKRRKAEGGSERASQPAASHASTRLKDILADPRQSRRAVVLREILGPPVALKR